MECLCEGNMLVRDLCYVVFFDEKICGVVWFWFVCVGDCWGLLFGLLVVCVDLRDWGIGFVLMRMSLDFVRMCGYKFVVFVGDLLYYECVGF